MAVERGEERKEELARMIIEGRARPKAAGPQSAPEPDGAAQGPAGPAAKSGRLTYEQLASAAGELERENARLRRELGRASGYVEELQVGALLAYADRLFKVLEQSVWFDEGYVQSCAESLKGVVGLIGSVAVGGGGDVDGAAKDPDGGQDGRQA